MLNQASMQKDPKDNSLDHSLQSDFKYKHSNPYHDKLAEFDQFVLRDNDTEQFVGTWNEKVFLNNNPIHLEIGTGFGHFMHEYSAKNPGINFVGLDYRFKRSFQLAKKLQLLTHKNFRYLRAKGERIAFMFGENELETIFYFFPDPWPKTRHQKKRLFQTAFLNSAYQTLKPGGLIQIKTDHDGYYEWMLERAQKDSRFNILLQTKNLREEYPEHFLCSFETEFEKIFIAQGTKIKALVLQSKK